MRQSRDVRAGFCYKFDKRSRERTHGLRNNSMKRDRSAVCIRIFGIGVVLAALVSSASAQDLVRFRLEATNETGAPIDEIDVGDTFMLKGFVDDLRDDGTGVFAAYVDIMYDGTKATLVGDEVTYEPSYEHGHRQTLGAGLLDDVGGFAGIAPLGSDERMLFELPILAQSTGLLEFTANDGGDPPFTDFLLYDDDRAIPMSSVAFGSAAINVVPEPTADVVMLMGLACFGWWRRGSKR